MLLLCSKVGVNCTLGCTLFMWLWIISGSLKDTMSLLKPIHTTSMLIPCEELLIQTFHQNGNLIPEQNCGEQNPLFMLATDYSLM